MVLEEYINEEIALKFVEVYGAKSLSPPAPK